MPPLHMPPLLVLGGKLLCLRPSPLAWLFSLMLSWKAYLTGKLVHNSYKLWYFKAGLLLYVNRNHLSWKFAAGCIDFLVFTFPSRIAWSATKKLKRWKRLPMPTFRSEWVGESEKVKSQKWVFFWVLTFHFSRPNGNALRNGLTARVGFSPG